MAKIKITNKEAPFLKRELELDEGVAKKLAEIQKEYREKFKGDIERGKNEALERYKSKVAQLKKAKSDMTRKYNEEIKKYEALIEELGESDSGKPAGGKAKRSSRKTTQKKSSGKSK